MRHMIALSSLLAALALSAPQAGAQGMSPGQQGKFCLKEDKGAINCTYATMAACEQAKTGNADQCTEKQTRPDDGVGNVAREEVISSATAYTGSRFLAAAEGL
jgi:hypothetical protein